MQQFPYIKLLFVLFTAIGIGSDVKAQDSLSRRLDHHLSRNQSAVTEMYRSRSAAPWYWSRSIDSYVVKEALESYPGADLIFYHHSGDTLHSWYIGREQFLYAFRPHITAESLQNLERDFKQQISHRNLSSRGGVIITSEDSGSGHAGEKLAKALFPEKIADKIRQRTKEGIIGLAIVPTLNIASIPLYALQPFRDSSFIIDHIAISLVPTIAEFLKRIHQYSNAFNFVSEQNSPFPDLEKNFKSAGRDSFYFIPPQPLIIGNPDLKNCSTSLADLKGAEKESAYTASRLNTQSYIGHQATRELVMDKMKGSSFLYFATHAIGDTQDAMNKSFLLLSGRNECAKWTSREIQQLKFNNDALVILSACETGIGRSMEAGITGLSRAFIIGGAANVIMSLWKVDDEATRKFMQIFMNEMTKEHRGFFPAAHLRQAILAFRKTDPRFSSWAAFTNMGVSLPTDRKIRIMPQNK